MPKSILRMMDVHSHILPGVDDGARDMDMTRAMLTMAWDQGIRTIIATPHYDPAKKDVTAEKIRALTEKVQEEAKKIHPEMKVFCGNEIFYVDGAVDHLKDGRALTLADTSYVLVEFYGGVSMRECVRAVRSLTKACYRPVIAHAERYPCLRKEGALRELIQLGAYIQINYSSLPGSIFDKDSNWVKRSVKDGEIHLFGTDMHDLNRRKPETSKAVKTLMHCVGAEEAESLLWDNPQKLLANQYI